MKNNLDLDRKIYYVITLRGVPIDITSHWHRALQSKAENTGSQGEAQIVPVTPIETEELGGEQVENPGDWGQLDLPLADDAGGLDSFNFADPELEALFDFSDEDPTDPDYRTFGDRVGGK